MLKYGENIFESIKCINEDIKKVYELLEDKKSKEIYLYRLLYNFTDDYKFMMDMIRLHFYDTFINDFKTQNIENESLNKIYHAIQNKKLVVYGIGYNSTLLVALIKKFMPDVNIITFCDRKADKIKKFFDWDVINIETLVNKYDDCTILVTPSNNIGEEIYKELIQHKIDKNKIIYNLITDNDIKIFDDMLYKLAPTYQYFDKAIKLPSNPVFIDGGCYDCETDIEFIKRYPDYEKIVAFEPDSVNIEKCRNGINNYKINKITLYECGLWNKKDTLYFNNEGAIGSRISSDGNAKIEVNSIDNIMKGQKVDFIKLDVEGAELKALEGAQETIKKYKPSMAICVYHKKEDIIDIPLYINNLSEDYKFYMRHYSSNNLETVLYAIPNNQNQEA